MEMNYCRRCGTKLNKKSADIYKCEQNHTIFEDMAPSSGILFINADNNVTLSVRGIEPFKGKLDAFGGFFDLGEDAPACMSRELEEELGLGPEDYSVPEFLATGTTNYVFEGEARTVLGLMHWSRLKPGVNLKPADDVTDTKTIPLSKINMEDIGADDVKAGIEALKKKFPQ